MRWLIEKEAFQELQQAIERVPAPSAEQLEQFIAGYHTEEGSLPRIMRKVKNTGVITVTGVLTSTPSWYAKYFGGGNTTYGEIIDSIAALNADDDIKEGILVISSPGGQANSDWLAAMDAIHNSAKPIRAIGGSLVASAAYGLASQAKSISAQNEMSLIGSVGVVSEYYVSENRIAVTSTNAPNKRPDVTTDDGKAAVRETLDQIESIFIRTIARGRNVSESKVKRDFGRGGLMTADEAKEAGMIDSLETESGNSVSGNSLSAELQTEEKISKHAADGGNTNKQEATMDLAKLMAEHPALHAEVMKAGAEKEQRRVLAHLKMGKKYGAMEMAMKAIESGESFEPESIADYMTAEKSAETVEKQQTADAETGKTLDAADSAKEPEAKEKGDELADALLAKMGIEL